MRIFYLIIAMVAAVSSFGSAFARAEENRCLDEEKIAKQVKHFKFVVRNDELSTCDPSNVFYRVLEALVALDELPNLDSGKVFDNNIIGPSAIEYLRARVDVFEVPADWGSCKKDGVGAFVMPWRYSRRVMVCPLIENFSPLTAMGVLIHEARHLDPKRYSHVRCYRGLYQGYEACDPSYRYKGSYAAETELKIRLASTESLPKSTRREARASAVLDLLNRFNDYPRPLEPGVLVQDVDGRIFHVSESGRIQPYREVVPDAILTQVLEWATVIFDAETGAVRFFNVADAPGDLSDVLETAIDKAIREEWDVKRERVKDVLLENRDGCVLSERELACFQNGRALRVDLGGLSPRYITKWESRLGFTTDSGTIYLLPSKRFKGDVKLQVADLKKVQNPNGFVSVFPGASKTYFALTSDGRLVKTDAKLKRVFKFDSLEGYRFKKIVGQLVWSKAIDEI